MPELEILHQQLHIIFQSNAPIPRLVMAAQVLVETRVIVILVKIVMGSANIAVMWVMDALVRPQMVKGNAKKFVKVIFMR